MRVVSYTKRHRSGVTLIELLLVVVIVAILAGLTLVALNPKKNLDDTGDAKRQHDLRTLIDALYQYQIDHDEFPAIKNYTTLDEEQRPICSLTGGSLFFCNFVLPADPKRLPLGPLIPDYLAELPHDPENKVEYETGYQLRLDNDGRIHAFAPLGNNGIGIEVAR